MKEIELKDFHKINENYYLLIGSNFNCHLKSENDLFNISFNYNQLYTYENYTLNQAVRMVNVLYKKLVLDLYKLKCNNRTDNNSSFNLIIYDQVESHIQGIVDYYKRTDNYDRL